MFKNTNQINTSEFDMCIAIQARNPKNNVEFLNAFAEVYYQQDKQNTLPLPAGQNYNISEVNMSDLSENVKKKNKIFCEGKHE